MFDIIERLLQVMMFVFDQGCMIVELFGNNGETHLAGIASGC